jgi:F-type H+-transporting ATPase subunit epsilon
MNTFKLKLIAPDGVKYEQEVSEVILPTPNGEIAILSEHMPLVSLLSPGEIIVKEGNTEHHLATEGGVVEVGNNEVKVIADTAEEINSLDELKIEEAKKAATQRLTEAKDDTEYADALAHLEKQLAKEKIVRRKKHH